MVGAPARIPPAKATLPSVPRDWPGETVAILANGPSLNQFDIDRCRGLVRVLAIKDAIRLAPWADCLYACDAKWWRHYAQLTYTGPRYSLDQQARQYATVLRNTGEKGLEFSPTGLRTGRNSGYQAINLAVHFGVKRILLLGYDMQPGQNGQHHWFGKHPWPSHPPYRSFLELFDSLPEPLAKLGVEVINCSPRSVLQTFPVRPLVEVLG